MDSNATRTLYRRPKADSCKQRSIAAVVALGFCTGSTSHAQPCGWESLPGGGVPSTLGARVRALSIFEYQQRPALYAGGTFRELFGSPGNRIARWDGKTWARLGEGLNGSVYALAIFDDGTGPALYAGGTFSRAGDIPDANGVARWDGREWSALGSGLHNDDPTHVHNAAALVVFDDGSGPDLYVGGHFTEAGGVPAVNVARWDGHEWSAVGEGLEGTPGIRALAVYDDGTGPALYAGGFTTRGLARWDGESWETVDSDVGAVNALAVFDDGTGPGLYAGGQFSTAGGAPANRIARWDGESWSPLGSGTSYEVRSLHVFDDGRGPALYVGGAFAYAGGVPVYGIARWDGREWSDPGGGLFADRTYSVDSMTTFDDGSGPALYAGGRFSYAGGPGGVPVDNIARWRCESACYADCDESGELDFFDFLCFQNEFAAQTPYADCDASGGHDFFDFLCFQNEFAAGCQ